MTATTDYEEVLSFWLGPLREDGSAEPSQAAKWWKKDDTFDALVRSRFGALSLAVRAGERASWLAEPRGRLAFVIVLDQFSRNMHRNTPEMFAADGQALQLVLDGIAAGADRRLATAERTFFYMPLMHSEDLAMQERCVALFTAFRDEAIGDAREPLSGALGFAIRHRDIVARFGRFPHRNAILGRASTPEEEQFLAQPGSSF